MISKDLLNIENIRFAQVETSNYCNYQCPYCQITYDTRQRQLMSLAQFQHIVEQLNILPSLETVYLNGYNEPTIVPEIVEQVRLASKLDTELVLLTNATGLTENKYDELSHAHPRLTVDIHISAIKPSEYLYTHGVSLNPRFLQRLHTIIKKGKKSSITVRMMVMGKGDNHHIENWRSVQQFFSDTDVEIGMDVVHDRAGALPYPYNQGYKRENVIGCSLDNRYSDWVHITTSGKWILCCQDYEEKYVYGNMLETGLLDIAKSNRRREIITEAMGRPTNDDLTICRRCHYAIFDVGNP